MYNTTTNTTILNTKQHFKILDGLRGIAAIAVVIFHFMEIVIPDPNHNFITHAYLAVDFFFCLSGFVIAYAYDQRLQKIGTLTFFKLRLIRLHPLVIIGAVIGFITFIFDPFNNLHEAYSNKAWFMFIASCLMIPYPIVQERYFNLFHLNPPTWSLFWEYVANICYALVLVKLRNNRLLLLTFIAAIALGYESYRSGNLVVGWSGDNILGGGVRVAYSFLAGMLVYRSKWIINNRLGFPIIAVLLTIAFLIPFSDKTSWIIDPLLVLFYFPFLVALGAGSYLAPSLSKVCTFFGDLSYPLYMTHYPFIWIFLSYVEKVKPGMDQMILITVSGTIFFMLFAYCIMMFLDTPLRNYLKKRLLR